MPGALLHVGATVQCAHNGVVILGTTFNPQVRVSGHPIIMPTIPYTVAGCHLSNSAQWTEGAQRVKANGLPVVLVHSPSHCIPTSSSLNPQEFQQRVLGE